MQPQVLHCLLFHCLLLREICQPKSDEIWFDIYGSRLRFSLGEFCIVTGLKCVDDFDRRNIGNSTKNNLVDKYFYGSSKVSRSAIENRFLSSVFDCDDHALKIGILYFISNFLFFGPKDKSVAKEFFDVVDGGLYNEYPWGIKAFKYTLDSLKGRLIGVQIKEFDYYFYRLFGFPLALQVWFYESWGYCDGVFAVHSGCLIPCMLNWGDFFVLNFKKLNSMILNLSPSQVIAFFLIF